MSSTVPSRSAPRGRDDFHIAIFCALPLEAENVQSVFDICWEDQNKRYGKAPGDQNSYNTGVIGQYNVVLVHMPSMGGNSAALAAAGLRSSFRGIQLALVVGICGVVPVHPMTGEELLLGDIVISTAVSQYDFGRQYLNGFQRKNGVEDSLGRTNPEIRSFINMLTTRQNRQRFNIKLKQLVQSEEFQAKVPSTTYPGLMHDRLYEASYLHRHRSDVTCEKCLLDVGTCSRNCDELNCEDDKLITRHRPKLDNQQLRERANHTPVVHLGRFGSANTVMKSGLDRDRLSAADDLTAFEMEGAGVWEQYPTIIIKAACDYADSHKNKNWQKYAAAMAAGALSVFLTEWLISEPLQDGGNAFKPVWHVPFDSMAGFVGREDELRHLEQKLFDPQGSRTVALLGLGGVDKSRLALEFAFRTRVKFPNGLIFWVQASEQSKFEGDMLEICIKLGIPGVADEMSDVKTLVRQRLSNSEHRWVLILDNADDTTLWGKRLQTSLIEYLPRTTAGSILVTTRSGEVANLLAETDIIKLPTLSPEEAAKMFIKRLQNADLAADRSALSILLDQLAYLPLALVQAASYINETQRPIQVYINLMNKSEKHVLKLLSKDFGDRSRYQSAVNPVATTWLISFKHIQTHYPLAATLLSRMACLHEKRIPQSLLLDDNLEFDDIDLIDAVTILTGYSFITRQTATNSLSTVNKDIYDIHRLVQLAARNWLKMDGTIADFIRSSTRRLTRLLPAPNYMHRHIWTMFLPHAQRLCDEVDEEGFPERYEVLEKMGLWFSFDGDYDRAVKTHTMVLNWRKKTGLLDQRTFDAFGNLGEALSQKGELSTAENYLQQAFDWQKERLGEDNPIALSSMGNLVRVLNRLGKYSEAERLARRLLEVLVQVWGANHFQTLIGMGKVALALSCQGKYSEAVQMYRQVLKSEERMFGAKFPSTMGNLAAVLSDQGEYSEAEQMYRQVVAMKKLLFGAEHPATLGSINNLASVLSRQEKYSEAEQLYRQASEAMKRVLGAEHPDTLSSMNNLAMLWIYQGKYREAEHMHRHVLKAMKQVLGVEHPDTLCSMNNLALALGYQGKSSEAEQITLQEMEVSKRALGVEHPKTLTSVNNLAMFLRDQEKHSEAEHLCRQVVEARKRVLGIKHPQTILSMGNLARVLSDQGKYDEAEQIQTRAREASEVERMS